MGGNEAGWGDRALGGTAADRLVGQQGHDALYGEGGNDTLEGQYGDDLLVGGPGEDTLNPGAGADEVDAQDAQRDVINLTGSGPGDVVYYDRGIDEFVTSSLVEPVDEGSGASAAAVKATGAELSAAKPPKGLFEPHAKVLVDHKGERLLVAEERVEAHTGHGGQACNPVFRVVLPQQELLSLRNPHPQPTSLTIEYWDDHFASSSSNRPDKVIPSAPAILLAVTMVTAFSPLSMMPT